MNAFAYLKALLCGSEEKEWREQEWKQQDQVQERDGDVKASAVRMEGSEWI